MANAKKAQEMEVTENGAGAIALSDQRPDWVDPNSARGSEDVTARDIILPRVDVLQALSPQLKKSEAVYIPGAEQGLIFNTVSSELYGKQIVFVPVVFKREFVIWQDRRAGGGFRGAFPTQEQAEQELEMLENPDGHEIVETHVHFALILHPDGHTEEAVLSMSKSKRKVSRKLNSLIQMVPGDRFSRAYKLTAVEVNGPKGDYWSFEVTPMGFVPKAIWEKGQETYKAINAGERGIDRSVDDDVPEAGSPTV